MAIEDYIDVAMGFESANIKLIKKQSIRRNKSEYAYEFSFEDGLILIYWVRERKFKDGIYCKQKWLFR